MAKPEPIAKTLADKKLPPKNKGGRPRKVPTPPGPKPKLSDEATREKILEAFAFDCTEEEACFYAEISVDTLARYKKKNPQFAERIEQLRNTPVLGARQTMVKATRTDPKWAGWYLERKKKDEFATRNELTGPDGRELEPVLMFPLNIKPKDEKTKAN